MNMNVVGNRAMIQSLESICLGERERERENPACLFIYLNLNMCVYIYIYNR